MTGWVRTGGKRNGEFSFQWCQGFCLGWQGDVVMDGGDVCGFGKAFTATKLWNYWNAELYFIVF